MNATAFNQSLPNWNVQNVENMNSLFNGSGLNDENKEKIECWGPSNTLTQVDNFFGQESQIDISTFFMSNDLEKILSVEKKNKFKDRTIKKIYKIFSLIFFI